MVLFFTGHMLKYENIQTKTWKYTPKEKKMTVVKVGELV